MAGEGDETHFGDGVAGDIVGRLMAESPRSTVVAGFLTTVPLALPALPIGMVFGVLVNETDEVSSAAGIASAAIVMGGASQLAAVSLLGAGAGVAATVATIAAINARHIMYSARVRRRFRGAPLWFRLVGSYLLLDQVFAVGELHAAETGGSIADDDPTVLAARMAHHLGAGIAMAGLWIASVGVGVVVGDVVPDGWSLDFAVPLLFFGLLVLSISDRPGVVAAVVGAAVAVVLAELPNGSGLLLGAVAGVVAGGVGASWIERRSGSPPASPTGPGQLRP